MAKFSLRVACALAVGILITIGGCTDSHPTITPNADGPAYQQIEIQGVTGGVLGLVATDMRAEKVIGPEGGTLAIPGGHTLTFPAGALSAPTKIRAKASARYVEVDLGPEGLVFPAGSEPTLTLSYAGAGAVVANRLTIVYMDAAGRILEDLNGTVSTESKTVSAKLQHFSRYSMVGA